MASTSGLSARSPRRAGTPGGSGPVYLRVLEDLRDRIRSGALAPGARVPSRNAIVANYGVGETAAKHALAVLAAEGLIQARPGSGSYVRKTPAAQLLEHGRPGFPGSPFGVCGAAAAWDNGDRAAAVTRRLAWEHHTEQVPAPAQAAARLGLRPGETVVMTRYLLRSDGEPVQLAVSFEPAVLTAGTEVALPEQGPLAGRGVAERMRSIGVHVDEIVEDVAVRPALLAEAAALAVPAGAPALVVGRVQYAAGRAVEAAEVVVPGERFKLRYRFPVAAPPC